jgi:serine/threonine-protein phosphatase 2A regulatory subunit A
MTTSFEQVVANLKSDDLKTRLKSVSNITVIAEQIGPERTRDELLLRINDSLEGDDSEVLNAYGDVVPQLIEIIGGIEYAHKLLHSLELLSESEDSAVRGKAVSAICRIAENAPESHINEHIFPLVEKFSKSDCHTLKSSACGLFATVYSRVNDEKRNILRSLYVDLCKDETPMVRRFASSNLKNFVKKLDKGQLHDQIMPIFIDLSRDDQDSVRLLCIENCIAIGEMLTKEENKQYIKPIVLVCASDLAWRVRYMVANNFQTLVNILDGDTSPEILNAYIFLLKDLEPEVRCAATGSITAFCGKLPVDTVVNEIIPCVQNLVKDESEFVRAALAKNIGGLSPYLGPEKTNTYLLENYLMLLRDDHSEVRLNLLSHLSNITDIMKNEQISQTILNALESLISDKNWRTRLAAVEHLSVIASEMGVNLFKETRLSDLCFSLLSDSVLAIRIAGIENLKNLTSIFGIQWAKEYITPKIIEMSKQTNYTRMTTLKSILKLSCLFPQEDIVSIMLPILRELSADKVPNIRFNVCLSLEALSSLLDKEVVQSQIVPILDILKEDKDKDVRDFATRALSKL